MKFNWVLIALLLFSGLTLTKAQAPQYDREKLWEKEIAAFAEIDAKQTPPENAILFTGSSSIRLWKNLRTDFPDLKVINRGFGGSRLDDLNHYAPNLITPYKPKMIVVYSGENDIQDGQPAEDVLSDFKEFMAWRNKNMPKTPVVYISLKPSISRWKLWPEMTKANNLIKDEIRKYKGVKFADLGAKMLGADGMPLPDIFVSDGLHMNDKGYAIWRENLRPFLK